MTLDSLLGIQKPIALDPGIGGCSIGESALRPGDIIISTTTKLASGFIRVGTTSVVSHAAVYVGEGRIIEAIGDGVVSRDIAVSLSDDELAVAYRKPHLTTQNASKIIKYLQAQTGASYSYSGAAVASNRILCKIVGSRPAAFFCSQLVIEAYKQAEQSLTTLPSQCVTPEGVAEIAFERLTYVGHLKGRTSWLPVLSP